jgi:hypothetical protein
VSVENFTARIARAVFEVTQPHEWNCSFTWARPA